MKGAIGSVIIYAMLLMKFVPARMPTCIRGSGVTAGGATAGSATAEVSGASTFLSCLAAEPVFPPVVEI